MLVAESAVDRMLAEFGRFVILSPEQQMEASRLVRRWLDWPDGPEHAPPGIRRAGLRAKRRMIETNMRLVVSVARKYTNRGLPMEDLIQEGALSLNRAVELFDPARGYAFTTFSYWWVRQAMTRALSCYVDTIRVPCHLSDKVRHVNAYVSEVQQQQGRPPSDAEIQQALNITPSQLELLRLAILRRSVFSLDQKLPSEDGDLSLLVPCPRSIEADQLEEIELEMQQEVLASSFQLLSEREQFVLHRRHVQGASLRGLGRELGLTPERVRLIDQQALHKLRTWMGGSPAAASRLAPPPPGLPPAAATGLVVDQLPLLEVSDTSAVSDRPRRRNRRRKGVVDPGQLAIGALG